MASGKGKKTELSRIIHERTRLHILARLAGNPRRPISFNELKEALGLTSGNLSIHLKSLEEAGVIKISKRFSNNKSLTEAEITEEGIKALDEYLAEMESIIQSLKGKNKKK